MYLPEPRETERNGAKHPRNTFRFVHRRSRRCSIVEANCKTFIREFDSHPRLQLFHAMPLRAESSPPLCGEYLWATPSILPL